MMESLQFIFRWLHVFVGIIWIGHLYFFNFVNGQMAAKLDGPTKQKVVPELMPRALYWFRWGAAWTWVTGVLLLLLIFYHGGLAIEVDASWGAGPIAMIAVTFLAVFGYDALWKSGLKSNVRAATIVSFLLLAIVVWMFVEVGGFLPRSVLIHTGAMFGTMMAFNVWFRIWAGAAADHRRGEGRQGPGRGRPGPRRAALQAQHLHVAAAAVGDAQRARDPLLRRQPRDSRRLLLGGVARGGGAGVVHSSSTATASPAAFPGCEARRGAGSSRCRGVRRVFSADPAGSPGPRRHAVA